MRQLRQPARSRRPDQPALEDRRRRRPVFRETKHLFLDLPAFDDRLREWIGEQEHWRPNVRNFSLELVDELKPRAITRDLDWGVRDPGRRATRRATTSGSTSGSTPSIGYLSARDRVGARTAATPDAWRDWWQNPDARHYYFMGKDNIVFHSVIWPAMLLGYGEGGEFGAGRGALELPYDIVASEFLTMEGKQVRDEPRRRHLRPRLPRAATTPDPLRYFLTAAGPGDAGHRLHLGRVRPPQQRRAASRTGATSSTGR